MHPINASEQPSDNSSDYSNLRQKVPRHKYDVIGFTAKMVMDLWCLFKIETINKSKRREE